METINQARIKALGIYTQARLDSWRLKQILGLSTKATVQDIT